jgi:phosphoserine aminotransferase
MVLINLLCFNENIMGVNLYETKCIIALSVIIAALSGEIFLKKIKIKNMLHSLPIISYI